MDAYIDLSFIYSAFNILTLPFFINKILNIRFKTIEVISLIFFQIVLYFNAFLFSDKFFLNYLFLLIYFLLVNKKEGLKYYIIYILVFYSNASYAVMLSDDIYFYNGVILLNHSESFIYIFTIFINIFFFKLVMMTIRGIKLLNNYKMNIILEIEGEKYKVTGYMDSGNTLKKNDLPVIFINESFKGEGSYKKMIVSGIGYRKCEYIKGKIIINNNLKEVICAFVNDINFKGCNCLLNVYLMEE